MSESGWLFLNFAFWLSCDKKLEKSVIGHWKSAENTEKKYIYVYLPINVTVGIPRNIISTIHVWKKKYILMYLDFFGIFCLNWKFLDNEISYLEENWHISISFLISSVSVFEIVCYNLRAITIMIVLITKCRY